MDINQLKGFRDFAILYNRIVENCFNSCIYTFNYRYLINDELKCIDACTQKYSNTNIRLSVNFSEIQTKKLMEMQENMSAVATETSKTVTETATPTNSSSTTETTN